jgi:hypothetical protein
MAEKYVYHDFNYANYFERFSDSCGWFKANLTTIPRVLGSTEQRSLAGKCLKAINREVKHYRKTTPRGVRSKASDDLFTRLAMCLNYLENVSGRCLPIEADHDEEEGASGDSKCKGVKRDGA